MYFLKTGGILIEPSLKGYELCKKNRPKSICINCVCVSNTYNKKYIYGDFQNNNPMASIDGKRIYSKNICKVNADTLENILNKEDAPNYEAVYDEIQKELDKMYWYDKRIFELINSGESIASLSRKTHIAYYSLYNTYTKVKTRLKKLL